MIELLNIEINIGVYLYILIHRIHITKLLIFFFLSTQVGLEFLTHEQCS